MITKKCLIFDPIFPHYRGAPWPHHPKTASFVGSVREISPWRVVEGSETPTTKGDGWEFKVPIFRNPLGFVLNTTHWRVLAIVCFGEGLDIPTISKLQGVLWKISNQQSWKLIWITKWNIRRPGHRVSNLCLLTLRSVMISTETHLPNYLFKGNLLMLQKTSGD